jgi:replicative DNA helicase
LRERGAIEQDADKVFFIYRPEYYGFLMDEEGNSTIRVVEMILSKNRNGRLNSFRLFANNNYTRYDEIFSYKENFEFNSARLNELENGNETNPF